MRQFQIPSNNFLLLGVAALSFGNTLSAKLAEKRADQLTNNAQSKLPIIFRIAGQALPMIAVCGKYRPNWKIVMTMLVMMGSQLFPEKDSKLSLAIELLTGTVAISGNDTDHDDDPARAIATATSN